MKNIHIIWILLAVMNSSCIDWGLEELPAYDEAEITDFDLEYRYVTTNANGVEQLAVVTLGADVVISEDDATITVTPSIPAPSGSFTQEERRKVSLESIVAYAKLSPAAKIVPLDGAPKLGIPGNFSEVRRYKVVAADKKTSKEWTVIINSLPVINRYEGAYQSVGSFDHPSAGLRNFDYEKWLSTIDESTVETIHSDLGGAGYKMRIKINGDNSVDVMQYAGDGSEIGEVVPGMDNKYDPTTKTFTLNYRYMGGGGYRVISETLTLK